MIRNFFKRSAFAKVSVITIGLLTFVLACLFYYLTYNEVASNNVSREVTANLTAQSVMEKVDRNFYERFGDVQAFAFNRLAVQTADKDSVAPAMQQFINTMTAYYVLYDLMMLCDRNGKVLVVNTKNKNGEPINSGSILNSNVAEESWFTICTSPAGPKGGAWFSDFVLNKDVANIYGTNGAGMAFAAPIRNDLGEVIGVWYNFASWQEVTEGIREEAEENLLKEHEGSFVVMTRQNGEIISARDKELMQAKVLADSAEVSSVQTPNDNINIAHFNIGQAESHGAYTFEGKDWRTYVFIPRANVSWSVFFSRENFSAVLVCLVVISIIAFFVFQFFRRNIIQRLHTIRDIQYKLSEGEVVRISEDDHNEDEIGQMAASLGQLAKSVQLKSTFADEIAKGNLSAELPELNANDVLGNSLVNMRNQLSVTAEAEKQRNWTTEGLAKIGDILHASQSTDELYYSIIKFVVTYSRSNQGGLFLINEEDDNRSLDLLACYAYEKKKFLTKQIEQGQGLIGQCAMEGETIHLTEIPNHYISITSGLGGANPNSLILLPLKVNGTLLGVIEVASFHKFLPFEITFLEKLTESIAASIGSIRMNDRTREMVGQLQQQTEEMKSQEEEMRQNMEELSATQEEMLRKEQEYLSRIRALESTSSFVTEE